MLKKIINRERERSINFMYKSHLLPLSLFLHFWFESDRDIIFFNDSIFSTTKRNVTKKAFLLTLVLLSFLSFFFSFDFIF